VGDKVEFAIRHPFIHHSPSVHPPQGIKIRMMSAQRRHETLTQNHGFGLARFLPCLPACLPAFFLKA